MFLISRFFLFQFAKNKCYYYCITIYNLFCVCSSLIARKLSNRNIPVSQLTPAVVICVTTYPCGCHNLPRSGATCDKLTISIFGALIVNI